MHCRFAGSGSNCLEGELEKGAGKGPLRCHGDDATPAGHVGCTQSRADGSVRARGACGPSGLLSRLRKPYEGGSAASVRARGRFRAACAVLRAEERGRVESQRLAAARRSE